MVFQFFNKVYLNFLIWYLKWINFSPLIQIAVITKNLNLGFAEMPEEQGFMKMIESPTESKKKELELS